MTREEYIKAVTEKYLECEGRYFGDCPVVSRRPQKRDIEAMNRAADEKLKCSIVLEAIEDGSKAYKVRNPRVKRIPAFNYYLSIARIKAQSVPNDPCDQGRKTKQEDNDEFLAEVRILIEQLSGDFPLPDAGREMLRESAALIGMALKEAEKRRAAGRPSMQWLMDEIGRIENEFHKSAREGIEERQDRILWLRQAADAKAWLDRYERTEPVTTWLIVNHAFKTLGIPVNWIKGV